MLARWFVSKSLSQYLTYPNNIFKFDLTCNLDYDNIVEDSFEIIYFIGIY